MDLTSTLQKINKIVPNLTVSQLLEIINIINEPINDMVLKGLKDIPHNGLIAIDTSNNKTTSTTNPFSISSYL